MDLGTVLLRQRKRNKYTQKQIADFLEVSQSTYCDWESGTTSPKAVNILKISKLYGLDINEMLNTDHSINILRADNYNAEIAVTLLKVTKELETLAALLKKII